MCAALMAEDGREPVAQDVLLTGKETAHTLYGYNVNIHPSSASALDSGAAGSNKVKIHTVTNQNWELPSGRGRIVASNNEILAYVLQGKSGHVLRLIHPESGNRALLKGFVGAVVDVAFAHGGSGSLACVDEGGNVYLWDMNRVEDIAMAPSDALCVVIQASYESDGLPHRLVWNPHIGGEEEEETLVVTHGRKVEVINVPAVMSTVPTGLKINRSQLDKGILTLADCHSENVCDVSLSPDGQVLATCSEDGLLKFWSMSQHRCLHQMEPHGGRPVTRLMFCDNHISQDPSNQFWRFLLTAADNNTELNVWCTVSWKCLQTIRFHGPPTGPTPFMLMNLDLSASYLVAADAMRAVVYVLQLSADGSTASLTSLTEYLLKQPIFSFIVPGSTHIPQVGGASSDSDSEGEMTDSRLNTVGIRLHTIHNRSMQKLEIRFDPPDLTGVPPDHTPDHTPSDNGQPSSLPLFSSSHGDLASFHSLTETGSPRLLTPSHFTSTSKPALLVTPLNYETTPTKQTTSLPPIDQSSFTSVTMDTVATDNALPVADSQVVDSEVNFDLSTSQSNDLVLPAEQEIENVVEEGLSESEQKELNDGQEKTPVDAEPLPLSDDHGHSQETTNQITPAEFVSLPKSEVEAINNGTIVTAAPVSTPPENLVSLKRVNSTGDSSKDNISSAEQEEVWPDIGGPHLPTKIVSKDQDLSAILSSASSVYDSPPGGSNVYNNPVVGGGSNVFEDTEGAPVVNEELIVPPAKEDAPPPTEPPVVATDGMILPSVDEGAPVISDEAPPDDTATNEQTLTMPSGHVESPLDAFNAPKLLLAEGSHDQSHDMSGSDAPQAVSSTEQLSQLEVKGHLKGKGKKKRKKVTVDSGLVGNSQSEGEISESVSSEMSGSLLSLVARQQEEIAKLRRDQSQLASMLERRMDDLQIALLKAQREMLQEQAREQDGRLDRVLKEKQSSEKARQEKLASALTNSVTGAVKNKLDHVVKNEMKNLVLPAMRQSMVSIQNDLSALVAQRVTATDTVVREGINQILHTRGLSESIAGAVAGSLQRIIAARYEEAFKTTVLPGFDKACQEMFRQIDEAFRRGTTEYLDQLTQHNRQVTDMTMQHVTQTVNSLVAAGQGSPLGTQIQSCMRQEMSTLVQHIQQVVVKGVASCVAKEIDTAFQEHYKQSPEAKREEEKKRKEEELQRLIGEQQFNSAFERVLSTNDLKLVVYLCGQVNPDVVFDETPCPLSQHVLLSLIQQLSVGIQDQLELKIKYLEHSLLALDVGSEVTKNHMTPVVSQLSQQLSALEQSFQANPAQTTPTLMKLVKRLKMMADHLTMKQ